MIGQKQKFSARASSNLVGVECSFGNKNSTFELGVSMNCNKNVEEQGIDPCASR